jgi:hypothetical protein
VAKLTYAEKSILFTGDAPGKLFDSICFEKQPQKRWNQKDNKFEEKYVTIPRKNNINALQNINILICPHHGSMSEGSYRWRGELDHPWMISIISSNPTGPHNLPEKSFMNYTLSGPYFDYHSIAYYSKLWGSCYRNTSAPIFVTGCSDVGYHVHMDLNGVINIAKINNDCRDFPIQKTATFVHDSAEKNY